MCVLVDPLPHIDKATQSNPLAEIAGFRAVGPDPELSTVIPVTARSVLVQVVVSAECRVLVSAFSCDASCDDKLDRDSNIYFRVM